VPVLVDVRERSVPLQDCPVRGRADGCTADEGIDRAIGQRIHELRVGLVQLIAPHEQEVGARVGSSLIHLGIFGDRRLDVGQVIDLAKRLGLDVVAVIASSLLEHLLEVGVIAHVHAPEGVAGDVPLRDDTFDRLIRRAGVGRLARSVQRIHLPQELLVVLDCVEQLASDVLGLDEVHAHVVRLLRLLAGRDELLRVGEDVPRLISGVGRQILGHSHAGEDQHGDEREQGLTELSHDFSPFLCELSSIAHIS